MVYTTNTPRRPQLRGGRKEKPARGDLRAGKSRHHCTTTYHHVVKAWSMLVCMRQNGESDASVFQSRAWHVLEETQKLSWPGFRQGIGTLPFLSFAIGSETTVSG